MTKDCITAVAENAFKAFCREWFGSHDRQVPEALRIYKRMYRAEVKHFLTSIKAGHTYKAKVLQ